MTDDQPLHFQLLFTLPDYNVTKRHLVGGARGQIDIPEEAMEAWERMVTFAVRHEGAIFAAAVVVVVENKEEEPLKIRSWRERKVKN